MNALAVHAQGNNNRHWVGLNKLRVLVVEHGADWFAQGVDLDYAAAGHSLEEVQRNFEEGLASTICLHLERFNSLDRLLKLTPPRVLDDLTPKQEFDFSMSTTHDLNDALNMLPFGGITYLPAYAPTAQ